ncbi:hypothetical protein ACLBX9_25680 [Methylobacterium sp. A49B]
MPGQSHTLAPAATLGPEPAQPEALERIARTLGVPITSFFPDRDQSDMTVAQAADLVAAFAAITSPAARRTCLAFVRAMASS